MYQILENLKRIREMKNFTQEYVADKLGVSCTLYNRMENEKASLSLQQLERIAKILEVSVQDIFNFNVALIFNNCNQQGAYIAQKMKFQGHEKDLWLKLFDVIKEIVDDSKGGKAAT